MGWAERFELDVQYVDNWSWATDLKIMAKTVVIVLRRQGVSAEGHVTMPEFLGVMEPAVTDREPAALGSSSASGEHHSKAA